MANIFDVYSTETERIMFLHGLIRMVKADGIIDPAEVLFFEKAAIDLGVNKETVDALRKNLLDNMNEAEYLEVSFPTKAKALLFVRMALQLCYADGVYCEKERLEVINIANELNVSMDSIKKIEKWVKQGIAWNEAGDKLLMLEN